MPTSVSLDTLVQSLDSLLKPAEFRDYCPNGLQVEGRGEVTRLVTGVTASLELIESAIEQGADALLVHHGYFWHGENPAITGIKKNRLRRLLQENVSLLAYHLPLDAHPRLGNNAQLGARLGFSIEADIDPRHKSKVGVWGHLDSPCSAAELNERIGTSLGRAPLHIPGRSEQINTIAWCTGAAQGFIEKAHGCGVDAYLSGEVSEQTVHFARESGIHFFAAGHHATERYGVQAVGRHVQEQLGIEHLFIDIDNPV